MNAVYILALTWLGISSAFPLFKYETDVIIHTHVVHTTATVTCVQPTTTSFVTPSVTEISGATIDDISSLIANNNPFPTEKLSKPVVLAKGMLTKNLTIEEFYPTIDKIWSRFWAVSGQNWNDEDSICGTGSYSQPVVWTQAVVGRAITDLKDINMIDSTIANIYRYRNPTLKVYSATEAGDNDIYNDDNAQVAWVFVDAYRVTGNREYLRSAQDIVDFLISQWHPSSGGVMWYYNGDYISSISTTEAALAAIRLYSVTQNQTLLSFAASCMDFMFERLQDPNDHLFYDGLDKHNINNVNRGKLTYTVGTGISTLAYLYDVTNNSTWLDKAIELGNAALNQNGAFYGSNRILNNHLKYVHLLFSGFADLFTIVPWQDSFNYLKTEIIRQGNYIYDFLQDPNDESLYFNSATGATRRMYKDYESVFPDGRTFRLQSSIFCNNNVNGPTQKVLLDNASAAQIIYEMSRL